jgi:hypothetical protein
VPRASEEDIERLNDCDSGNSTSFRLYDKGAMNMIHLDLLFLDDVIPNARLVLVEKFTGHLMRAEQVARVKLGKNREMSLEDVWFPTKWE